MVFQPWLKTIRPCLILDKVASVPYNRTVQSLADERLPNMAPQIPQNQCSTASMAYTHCKTRIVNLVDLNIPDSSTEEEYIGLYKKIIKSGSPSAQLLNDAFNSISQGIAPPVAFPTETVYGLGADATNRASIAGIFAAKNRPPDNPLIVHVASRKHLERLTGEPIPQVYADLVKQHWPGPLTILVPVPKTNSVFAENVHPGQQTIGFRVPESKYARFFIAATGRPIAGPSANTSGKPSPTTAQHVFDDLEGKINFILDGGNCNVGVESTVVNGLHDPPVILRPGGLSQDDLIAHGKQYNNSWANVIGHTAKADDKMQDKPPQAPGMKYTHYAPQGTMILFNGPNSLQKVQPELDRYITTLEPTTNGTTNHTSSASASKPLNIAILTSTSWPAYADLPLADPISPDTKPTYRTHTIHNIALGKTPAQIAQNLFAALRTCDDLKCRFIFVEAPLRDHVKNMGESMAKMGRVNRDEDVVGDGQGKGEDQMEEVEGRLMYEYDAVLERMTKASGFVVV